MAKTMSNNDIAAYEGGDYGEIMDNYDLHEITAAIANRAGKAAETFEELKEEVEQLENNPDVVDIVATYADLQAYDTSTLTDKDIIRVLEDETHDGESTYYRYSKSSDSWTYVGSITGGTTYTAGDGIDITNDIISATNTGKAKELTANDYNYPTDNPTYIYAGFLEPGLYHIPRGVYFRWNSAMSASNTREGYILVSDLDANSQRSVYAFSNDAGQSSSGEVDLFNWWKLSSTSVSWYSTKNAVWAQNLATNVYSSTASNYNVPSQLAVKNALCYPTNSNTVRIGAGAQSNAVVGAGGVLIGRNTGSNNLQDSTILIGSGAVAASNQGGVGIGAGTGVAYRSVAISDASTSNQCQVAIGYGANAGVYAGSIAFGSSSGGNCTAKGIMDIGSSNTSFGYSSTNYRLLSGVHDPQNDHDAATKGYVDSIAVGTDESYTIATSDWTALSASTPYTYQATITATATIGANSTVELINDNAVLFGTYGFAIGSVDTVNNQITIYSVGQPSASVTLTVNIKG